MATCHNNVKRRKRNRKKVERRQWHWYTSLDQQWAFTKDRLKETVREIYAKYGLPENTKGVMVCIACKTLVQFSDDGDWCECSKKI